MREERYSEDNANTNIFTEDIENTMKRAIMLTSTFKKYDAWCYSVFTDHLPTETKADCKVNGKKDSLKADEIVSFRKEFYQLTVEKNKEFNNEKENS